MSNTDTERLDFIEQHLMRLGTLVDAETQEPIAARLWIVASVLEGNTMRQAIDMLMAHAMNKGGTVQ